MDRIGRYSSMVEGELRSIVSDRGLPLYSMMEHHLGWLSDVDSASRLANLLAEA